MKYPVTLIGLMGSGKSTLGRLLQKQSACQAALPVDFIDLDDEIVRQAGKGIPQIFADEGEASFRRWESACLASLLVDDGCNIIATGGGAVLSAENRALMQAKSTVIWLDASAETLAKRIAGDANRPLLDGVDPLLKMRDLSAARNPLYAEIADVRIDTDALTHQQAVSSLLEFLAE